jgi:hypothetical protein
VKELWEDETRRYWILRARNPEHKDRVVRKDDEGFHVAAVAAVFLE